MRITKIMSLSLMLAVLPSLTFAQSHTEDIRPHANRIMGEDLITHFKGVTHKGAYNFDLKGRPGNLYTEQHHDDGRVSYDEGQGNKVGVWTIMRDMLCFMYKDQAMSGGCFRVYQVKNCYYYYSSDFVARDDELEQNYWIARSTKDGETAQCDAGVS